MRVDLHVHTCHSADSLATPPDILRWATRRRLQGLAITDHNTISGARALQAMAPKHLTVIVGEEIATTAGELIGLFLQESIPPGLSAQETIARIRNQGGLVYVPHPCDRVRPSAFDPVVLPSILEQVDIIEVLNARVTFRADNLRALQLARAYRFLQGAGSDAHQSFEIGQAFVEMMPFTSAASFLHSLAHGQVRGDVSSPLVHLASTYAKVAKGLFGTVRP